MHAKHLIYVLQTNIQKESLQNIDGNALLNFYWVDMMIVQIKTVSSQEQLIHIVI